MDLNTITSILEKILSSPKQKKIELIIKFQELVWNDESIKNNEIEEVLSTIAYDLDFYEPNERKRKEDPSFYGENRLEHEIKSTLEILNRYA